MLRHVFRGSPHDPVAFASACQALAAEAWRTRAPGCLVGASGAVLARVGDQGRFMPALSLTCDPEPLVDPSERPEDGWYRRGDDFFYVLEGKPFSLRRGTLLAVAPLDRLPEDALAVPEDDVDEFQQAGAELIEAFSSMGGA